MISDDKVGAKGVKVRCKKCGYVILVRRATAASAASAPPPPPPAAFGDEGDSTATQVMDNPLGGLPPPAQNFDPDTTSPNINAKGRNGHGPNPVLGAVPDDEISSVFDQVLNSGHHKVGEDDGQAAKGEALGDTSDDRMSTRVLDADTVQKLAAEAGGEAKNGEGKNGEAHHDWFVAVDEKQVGPLNIDKIKAMWDRGEIGPDSLCWRAGFSDWTALSEVQELASTLAPKPAKPMIVAPAAVGVPAVMTVPVESAFSAGGMMRTVRSEVPMVAGAAGQPEAGWRPSAASALQSLVKEEIEALTKPAPKGAGPMVMDDKPKAAPAAGGLLDLPDASPPRGNGKIAAAVEAAAPMAAPFAQPYQAQYPMYRPPAEDSSKRLMMIGGIVGLVLLLALVGLVGYLMASKNNPPPVQTTVARNDTTPPSAVQPTTPVKAAQPTTTATTPVTTNPPATTPAAGTQNTASAQPAKTDTGPHKLSAPTTPVGGGESGTHRRDTGSGGGTTERIGSTGGEHKSSASSEGSETKSNSHEKVKEPASGDDDEFSKTFGGGSSGGSKKVARAAPSDDPQPKKSSSKDVYIPPAPGSGGDIADQVSQGDITATVVSNKPAIINCVKQQKAKDPDSSGTIVMRWTIGLNGRTSGVTIVSDDYKSAPIGACLTGLIKGWNFPRHKQTQDPVNFPFKF